MDFQDCYGPKKLDNISEKRFFTLHTDTQNIYQAIPRLDPTFKALFQVMDDDFKILKPS